MAEDRKKDEDRIVHDPDDKNDKNETEQVSGIPTMGIIAPPIWGKILRPKRKKPGKK